MKKNLKDLTKNHYSIIVHARSPVVEKDYEEKINSVEGLGKT